MIDFLLDNWIIIGCFLFGGLLGLFASKSYKKNNIIIRSDEADIIPVQIWHDADTIE